MNPYFVIDIENNPVPMDADVYYLSAKSSQAIEFIEQIIDCLEVSGKPVTMSISVVEMNEAQVEYIDRYADGFDIDELNSLSKKEKNEKYA